MVTAVKVHSLVHKESEFVGVMGEVSGQWPGKGQ